MLGRPSSKGFGGTRPTHWSKEAMHPGQLQHCSNSLQVFLDKNASSKHAQKDFSLQARSSNGTSAHGSSQRSIAARQQAQLQGGGRNNVSRLNKRMAELGICSRREADDWIAQGLVLVDGQVAHMGLQVGPHATIKVKEQAHSQQDKLVTILLHKPVGYVSGQAEDGHAPAVAMLSERTHWRGDASQFRFSQSQLRGLAPAGRLDLDSTGLLVLTQDGRVARRLIGADSSVTKEYLVRVSMGNVVQNVQGEFPESLLAKLRHGLSLDGRKLRPARVEWQNPEQLRFVLSEGRKRQIRRMCDLVGLKVVGLKRVRIGRVLLGALPPGTWRYLAPNESF